MSFLSHIFQGEIQSRPEAGIQELLRAIVMRANFVPAVRYNIGWRGLKLSVAGGECWTAKIGGFAGVFGLLFNGVDRSPGWVRGRFVLHYFPDPEEVLVESCSLKAAALTQESEYMRRVREFSGHPELSCNFAIGQIGLSVNETGNGLALELESLSAQRTMAEEGIIIEQNGDLKQIIEPGGRDQDFPSLKVASVFFNVLASSLAYNLEQPPTYMCEDRVPAAQVVYGRRGDIRRVPADDVWQTNLLLGYGDAKFERIETNGPDFAEKGERVHYWRAPAPYPQGYEDRLWWHAHQLTGHSTIDRKTLGIDERPPFIILSGFLGAGKTSFLQHFIEYQTQRSRFVAVIQNEIGEIGLDGKLVDYTVTELDEGCVCCSLVGSMKRAVKGILDGFSPDAIIMETSGLANPDNILNELAELYELIRFDAIVTVVDALNFSDSIGNYTVAVEQIAAANVLVLNKMDLVDQGRLEELQKRLAEINPHAPVIVSCGGDVNPAMIFDMEGAAVPSREGKPRASVPAGHRTHEDDHLWNQTIRIPKVLDRRCFLKTISSLPGSVFRIKGIIDLSNPHQTLLFQYVGGRSDLSVFADSRLHDRFLTFIGKTECSNTSDDVEQLMQKIRFDLSNCLTPLQ